MALWLDELPCQDVLDGTAVLDFCFISKLKQAPSIFEHKPLLNSYVPRELDASYLEYESRFLAEFEENYII